MKNLINKGFKYFVAVMMVFSLMSMEAWANGSESSIPSETGSTTTENKETTKDTGDSQGDTADQLISNEEKKTNTSQESDDKEEQTDQTIDKKTDYTYEDKKISVKAVLANASAISDQAELKVKEIPESTTEYKKYQEALNKKPNLYSNVLLYDISFILNGKEVEPTDGQVKISMSFKDQQLSDDLKLKSANDLKVIHFKDNDVNKQEVLKSDAVLKKDEITFTTKSFSIVGISTANPNPFLTTNTFTSDGGEYTLEYLLKNYGVVSLGDVTLNNHTMANVLIGGKLTGTGSGFSDAISAAQKASSYIRGRINFTGHFATREGFKNELKPLYIGTVNKIVSVENGDVTINNTIYEALKNSNDAKNNQVYMTDNYVDWDKLERSVKDESKILSDSTTTKATLDQSGTLNVKVGDRVTVDDITKVKTINIVGDMSQNVNTIINIPAKVIPKRNSSWPEDSYLPNLYINGKQENTKEVSTGNAIVVNLPNADRVVLPSQNWVGHVIAPNADVSMPSGNYNGGIICKSFSTGAEGHLYPYNGGTLIPVKAGFKLTKTVDGEAPQQSDNGKFKFDLYEAKVSNNHPDWNSLTNLQETKNEGSNQCHSIKLKLRRMT